MHSFMGMGQFEMEPISGFGSLNENGPHSFIYLSVWSPVGGTVWEGLEGVALLVAVCHWG